MLNMFDLSEELLEHPFEREVTDMMTYLFACNYLTVQPRLAYIRAVAALLDSVTCGLAGQQSTPWSRFLTRGLYDPRLFLYIWNFV